MSVVTVQMTLMRYTDLSAQPRHNNNNVSALTPIITQQIRTVCETVSIHTVFFVQYGFNLTWLKFFVFNYKVLISSYCASELF